MTTPDTKASPGYTSVDANAVARVRSIQDTTGLAGTDTEILPEEAVDDQYPTRFPERDHQRPTTEQEPATGS